MKIFKAACVITVLGFIGLVALSMAAEHDMRVWCESEGGQYINKGCYTVINIPVPPHKL